MPAKTIRVTIEGLLNTRDLVAKIVELAKDALPHQLPVVLELRKSQVSDERARRVFDDTVSLLRPELGARLSLEYVKPSWKRKPQRNSDCVLLPARRNVRHELLRILLDAKIADGLPRTGSFLKRALELSEHPIRSASRVLEAAGLIQTSHHGRELAIEPWECTPDLLAKVDARPFRVSFRYRAGAYPLAAEKLAERFRAVGSGGSHPGFALSGATGIYLVDGEFDLSGLPRVDLAVHVRRDQRLVDLSWLHEIAPRMEREPNPLEQAPLVIEIVRTGAGCDSFDHPNQVARPTDIVLALLDQGLVRHARQFVNSVREAK